MNSRHKHHLRPSLHHGFNALRSFGNKIITHQLSLSAVILYGAGTCIGNNFGCRQPPLGRLRLIPGRDLSDVLICTPGLSSWGTFRQTCPDWAPRRNWRYPRESSGGPRAHCRSLHSLRSVGMTKGRVALPFRFDSADDEQQVPPLRYPGFPVGVDGVVAVHAPFFTEGRIRGLV
jgi:hypothetical protein